MIHNRISDVSRHRRQALLKEMAGRSQLYNQGGSSGRPLMTAYREAALYIARLLAEAAEPMSPRALRKQGADPKAQAILYDNYYGWFNRVGHGLYDISESGQQALLTYQDVVENLLMVKEGDSK